VKVFGLVPAIEHVVTRPGEFQSSLSRQRGPTSRQSAAKIHLSSTDSLVFNLVVDCERKSVAPEPIKSLNFAMNSGIQYQRIDLRSQAVEKVVPNTGTLPLVETKPC
jgi:hypothetical protein